MMGAYFPCAVAITSFFLTLAHVPPLAPTLLSLSIAPFPLPGCLLHPKHRCIITRRAAAFSACRELYWPLLILEMVFLITRIDHTDFIISRFWGAVCRCQRMCDTVIGTNENTSFMAKKLRNTLLVLPAFPVWMLVWLVKKELHAKTFPSQLCCCHFHIYTFYYCLSFSPLPERTANSFF